MTPRRTAALGLTTLFTLAGIAGSVEMADATPGHSTTTTTVPRTSSTSTVASTTTTIAPTTTSSTVASTTSTTACPPGSHPDGPVSPCAWDHPSTTVVAPPPTAPNEPATTAVSSPSSTTVPVPTSAQAASGGTVNQPRVGALPATGAERDGLRNIGVGIVALGVLVLAGSTVGRRRES